MAQTAISLKKSGAEIEVFDLADPLPEGLREKLDLEDIACTIAKSRPYDLFCWLREIQKKIKSTSPDIILTFDARAHAIGTFASNTSAEVRLISIKCGGTNPAQWSPDVKNQIVFSKENHLWFQRHRPKSLLTLLSNRVSLPKNDPQKLGVLMREHVKPILMRICRIDGAYDWTILQGASLASLLRQRGIYVDYVVIGSPKSIQHLERLKEQVHEIYPDTRFYHDEFYTKNAAQYLPAAEYVIGTGRGFMEGAGFSKIMFVPNKQTCLPIFCDEITFSRSFAYNFSGRTAFGINEIDESIERFFQLLLSDDLRVKYQAWMADQYKENFDASLIPAKYGQVIASCASEDRGLVATLRRIFAILHALAYIYLDRKFVKSAQSYRLT